MPDTKMQPYLVQFSVQAESLAGAMRQAERYLNVDDRYVDCNVVEVDVNEEGEAFDADGDRVCMSMPHVADRIEE